MSELLDHWRPYAMACTRGLFIEDGDEDDLKQEAMIALYIALRDYRPERGPLSAFVGLVVRRRLVTAIRLRSGVGRRLLTNAIREEREQATGETIGLDDLLIDSESDPLDVLIRRESVADLVTAFGKLSDLERGTIQHLANGATYEETAAALGCHFKAVDNARCRARRKFERELAA